LDRFYSHLDVAISSDKNDNSGGIDLQNPFKPIIAFTATAYIPGKIHVEQNYIVILIMHQSWDSLRIFFDIDLCQMSFQMHLGGFQKIFVIIYDQNFSLLLLHGMVNVYQLILCVSKLKAFTFRNFCPAMGKRHTESAE